MHQIPEKELDDMMEGIDTLFEINIRRTIDHKQPVPEKASPGAAGYDLRSIEKVSIPSGSIALVKTGFNWELPLDCAGLVCSRSGLALKNQVFVLNAPGIVDSDYRGDVGVILANAGDEMFHVEPGDRIAQMVVVPVANNLIFNEVVQASSTERGVGGFGHTGKH